MKGDFSRRSFDRKKHYSSVLMQQGRVQLDSDWNEQSEILGYLNRTTHRDVIGACGVPVETPEGFCITAEGSILKIGSGRMYVDGILCENESERNFTNQPDFWPELPSNPGTYMAFLDVWERHITALEDESIKELALGGPDTATRVKTVWQVKLKKVGDVEADIGCDMQESDWKPEATTGKMAARAEPDSDIIQPCILPEKAGYRGLENQLYRVEIQKSGTETTVTAKWSRDNGSIAARVEGIAGTKISIKDRGKDHILGFAPGQWVEVTNEETVLKGEAGALAELGTVDQNDLTVKAWPEGVVPALGTNLIVRRWDGVLKNLTSTERGGWLKLEDGVEVKFETGFYNTGDYWLIPARSAIGDVLWPKSGDTSSPEPPLGIDHRYCQLALLKRDASEWGVISDCRQTFKPLSAEPEIQPAEVQQACCCAVTVGENGDYATFGEALAGLPEEGGRIHLLAGVHQARILIQKRHNIHITGCDDQTIVFNDPAEADAPIVSIDGSHNIQIDHLTFGAIDGTAIRIQDSDSKDIRIVNNRIAASVHAVEIQETGVSGRIIFGKQRIIIRENRILLFNQGLGQAAILVFGNDISIVSNSIQVHPKNSAAAVKSLHDMWTRSPVPASELTASVNKIFLDASRIPSAFPPSAFETRGGIQIGGGSWRMEIVGNDIAGGYGSGITFGALPDLDELRGKFVITRKNGISSDALNRILENVDENLYDITIEENAIDSFGMSGIGVVAVFDDELELMISVQNLTVDRNTIRNCAFSLPWDFDNEIPETVRGAAFGGIALIDAENVIISQNRIEDNGTAELDPVCGIYLYHGEKIEISNNRILHNGSRPIGAASDLKAQKGIRGGIVIELGETVFDYDFYHKHGYSISEGTVDAPNGAPAVKIQDNIVVQPLGQALSIVTVGSILITGNNFTCRGLDHGIRLGEFIPAINKADSSDRSLRSCLGGAVYILNLGTSKDTSTFLNTASMIGRLSINTYAHEPQHFTHGYETTVDAELSLEDLEELIADSTAAPPFSEGHVLFSNNQTHLDLSRDEKQWVGASQFIFTLDDVSYQGNQSIVSSRGNLVLGDAVVWALTSRINGNRFQEDAAFVIFSLFSMAQANSVTCNQASHCVFVFGRDQFSVNSANTVLSQSLQFELAQKYELFNCGFLKNFFQTSLNFSAVPPGNMEKRSIENKR